MRYVHDPIVVVGTSNSIDNYGGLVVEKRRSMTLMLSLM